MNLEASAAAQVFSVGSLGDSKQPLIVRGILPRTGYPKGHLRFLLLFPRFYRELLPQAHGHPQGFSVALQNRHSSPALDGAPPTGGN